MLNEEVDLAKSGDPEEADRGDGGSNSDYHELLMGIIKLRSDALKLTEQTMARAASLLQESGWREKDAAEALRKEWFNDLLVDDAAFDLASGNPDEAFLQWLSWRAENPYHVTTRAVKEVGRKYGSDVAVLFQYIRWPQEIAWAKFLRTHDNTAVAVVSALFLTDVRRNPGQLFKKLAQEYCRVVAEDMRYSGHPNHELSEKEILNGEGILENWRPLYLSYSQKSFKALLGRLPPEKLTQLSEAARKEHERDMEQSRLKNCFVYLEKYPLSCRMTALHIAREEGMSSNDLVACEEAFREALASGEVPLPENVSAVDQSFFEWMKWGDYKPDLPDEEEIRRRVQSLAYLDKAWMAQLPSDIRDIGAERRTLFSEWRASILQGKRSPPKSLAVDYALYVLERHSFM